MTTVLAVFVLALTTIHVEPQEKPKIPDDSVELSVVGCLKGRVLTTIPPREADVQRGPNVGERTFRVNGKKGVMDEVKRRNKQLVEVVGLVKRSSLDDKGIKAGRVSISGGSPVSGTGHLPTGADNVAVMDVTAVRLRDTSCRAE
jgi:hypothetical protein